MERRYQVRLQELLEDAVVEPEQCQGMLSRLEQFVEPFAACLVRSKQRTLAWQYVAGLASQVKRKNVESIAYHHDQDRQMLQKFIGQYTWDHWPLVGGTGAASGRAHLPRRLGRRSTCASGDKGPLVVEAAKVLVRAKTSPRQGYDEMLIVVRERQSDGSMKHDYYLSNAPSDTPLAEFTRVAKAAHRIEECLHRDKSEAGLADYEVRTWRGWHHHQTLSLLATWFLTQETRRGEKSTPVITVPQIRALLASSLHRKLHCDHPETIARQAARRLQRNEIARFYHWKKRKRLAPKRIHQRR